MKRYAKLISVVLIAAMLLTTVSCAKRRKGAERIQSDGYAKPEAGLETDYTEPTETDPTGTEPDLPTPTTAPANNGTTNKGAVELLSLAESVCGMKPEDAALALANALGIRDFTTVDSSDTDAGGPLHRYMRYLDKDIICEGIVFKSISLHMKNGIVFSVDYSMRVESIFTQNEEFDSESANTTLTSVITGKYGQPIDGYTETWVDFKKSGITGWRDGDFIISMFWGKGCQGVDGNDQLVLGVENTGDITAKPTSAPSSGGSGNEAYTTEYLFIAGLLFIGSNQNAAKMIIESSFNTTLGNPVSTDKSDTSPSYTAYVYNCKIVVDGVEFDMVEIDVGDSTGAVYQVSFINSKEDSSKVTSYQKTFADKLGTLYEKQLTDKSSGDTKIQVCELDSGMKIESGSKVDGSQKFFWISFYNDVYLG